MKKILHTYRNFILFVIQLAIPVTFISITIAIVSTWAGNSDLPALKLSINTYNPTMTTIQFPENITDIHKLILKNYKQQFDGLPNTITFNETTQDMNEYYLERSKEFQHRVNQRYLFGVSFRNPKTMLCWFSNQPYHAAPISLNLLENALLRTVCGKNCSINVTNKPLKYRPESRVRN
jgi:ATP-binding cassette subfamily A (ABC1) protein 3